MKGNISEETLDEIDLKILKALQEDGKLTSKELAERVNLTTSPVHERQKRLEELGYIKKYIAILDAKKLGCGMTVLCNVKLKQHSKANGLKFVETINAIEEVTDCWNTSGDYDFMMKMMVRDMDHYQDLVLNTLGEIDSIGSLHSIFVMAEVKHSNMIPLHI